MTLSSDLERAVNELYRVFREYRLAVDFPGRCSPLGDRRKLAARLAKQELHTTGVDDLAVYAFKAITTMGNSVDYKHFLPRMFELMATDSAWWDHHTLVFQKLHELKWTSWPRAEQDAIRGFLDTLRRDALVDDDVLIDASTPIANDLARAIVVTEFELFRDFKA